MSRDSSESGQAYPIYLAVVAGLLFLAFAFFAVGMASASRNDAQGAADAAALAAAREARDGLRDNLLDLFDPDAWEDLLDGRRLGSTGDPCGRASEFARKNGAERTSCERVFSPTGFTVEVRNTKPVGDSLIPGTERQYATAAATAVIEPRCRLREAEDIGIGEEEDGAEEKDGKGHELICRGFDGPVEIDPDRLTDILPEPEDLFSVHLADR
ncbi:pilus assembly protein TadG-related protein [Streptomyces megasporus]|uniref:pilus assembly protein TadG-related protein n=1 Tax=Streptomyces megasporus TaxID=44060 RepID=UPI0004E25226|nr:pilus assembly protein TadG-related protein [Streptomyces megasporus]